jgi:hypothetical protein
MSDRLTLPYGDAEYVQQTARRIATHELMVADLSVPAWQISLALMVDKLAEYDNVGLILVPKAPHVGLYWVNNTAPGCTLSCQMLAVEDIPALEAELDRINAVLYPTQGTTMEDIKVNGITVEPSCVVDGDVHGQYAVDRLADVAIGFGLSLDDDHDPRHWRTLIAIAVEERSGMEDYFGEQMDGAADNLLALLNDCTEGGSFEWTDGSVFIERDDEDDDDADNA